MRKQQCFKFQGHNARKVGADFNGGYLSSDGSGALLFREFESKSSTIKALASCFDDQRHKSYVKHGLEELLRQRIGALVFSYEDLCLSLKPRHVGAQIKMGCDSVFIANFFI